MIQPYSRKTLKFTLAVHLRLFTLILLAIAAVGCGKSSAPPQLLNGVLCRSTNATGQPENPTKEFLSTDSVVRCVLIFQQSERPAVIRGTWSVVRVPGIKSGTVIGEANVQAAPNSQYVNLSLTPTSPLPAGDYQLEVFIDPERKIDSTPNQTLTFKIVSKGAQISNAFLASDPQGKQKSDAFPLNTSVVYAHLKLTDVPPRTTVTASWVQEGSGEIDRVPITLRRGEESVVFALTLENGLAPGNYRVIFFFNNQTIPAFTLPFRSVSQ